MLAVVTDSTCDLPPETARRLGLRVVPQHVLLEGRILLDGQDLDPEAVYDHQRRGGTVTTAPAPQGAFEALYRDLLATYDGVVSVHLSTHFSDTVRHARAAVEALNAGERVHVVDSGLASLPLAEAALAARDAVWRGGDAGAARAAVRQVEEEALAEFTVPTLEYLRRGGRLSRAGELVGNVLGVRPILRFEEGRLRTVRRVKAEAALRDILTVLEERFGDEPVAVTVGHAGRDPIRLTELKAALGASRLNVVRGRLQLLGPAIGAHVGPGTYGVMARPYGG